MTYTLKFLRELLDGKIVSDGTKDYDAMIYLYTDIEDIFFEEERIMMNFVGENKDILRVDTIEEDPDENEEWISGTDFIPYELISKIRFNPTPEIVLRDIDNSDDPDWTFFPESKEASNEESP